MLCYKIRLLLYVIFDTFTKPRDYATPATMPLLLGPDGWHSSGSWLYKEIYSPKNLINKLCMVSTFKSLPLLNICTASKLLFVALEIFEKILTTKRFTWFPQVISEFFSWVYLSFSWGYDVIKLKYCSNKTQKFLRLWRKNFISSYCFLYYTKFS